MNLGVGGRLLVAHLVLSAIVLGAVELALAPGLRRELERQLDDRVRTAAAAMARALEEGDAPAAVTARVARATGFRASVVGPDGFLIADSGLPPHALRTAGSHADRPEVVQARGSGSGAADRRSETTGTSTRYFALAGPGGRLVRAAADLDELDASMASVHRAILLAACIGLLLALVLGAMASHVAGRAVRALADAARRILAGERVGLHVPRGPGELAEIAAILERLGAKLQAQFGRLEAERDLLGGVIDAMEEAVLVLRLDGSVLRANPTAVHLLALRDVSQRTPLIETVRHPPLLDAVRAAAAGEAAPLELVLEGPPRRELVGRAAPLPAGSGAAVVVVLRDLTELRRLEAVRRDFVASASHELRTPVAAIRGLAESLAAGALDDRPTAERFVAGLGRQAERLSELIDGLLDLSRIESGGMRLQPERLPVAAALRRLADAFRDRAAHRSIDLRIDEAPADLEVEADPRAIDVVVGNLLDNAIKYTPAGGTVRLRVERCGGEVRFLVEDTGPGIAPEHLARIFERFYRVDAGRSRDVGGTGLGLAIARHVAQQSGGDLGVESRPGAGSLFWFRLPAAAPARREATSP